MLRFLSNVELIISLFLKTKPFLHYHIKENPNQLVKGQNPHCVTSPVNVVQELKTYWQQERLFMTDEQPLEQQVLVQGRPRNCGLAALKKGYLYSLLLLLSASHLSISSEIIVQNS